MQMGRLCMYLLKMDIQIITARVRDSVNAMHYLLHIYRHSDIRAKEVMFSMERVVWAIFEYTHS